MLFIFNADGTPIKATQQEIFQGSNQANTVYFLAPFSNTCIVVAGFRLPDGIFTPKYIMETGDNALLGIKDTFGVGFNLWALSLPATVTQKSGAVEIQFFVKNGTQTIATFTTKFTVNNGVFSIEPEQGDTYEDVLQYLAELNTSKQDVFQAGTIPEASESLLGKIVQYIGETDETYTNGYFYKCIVIGTTPNEIYGWLQTDVQPGGSGDVASVNGKTGVVVLNADDISDTNTTNKFVTASEISKLAGIEAGAEVNTVDSVNGQTGIIELKTGDIPVSDDKNYVSTAEKSTWNGKQNALTFDSTPTAGSDNPVTSAGIKSAIDSAVSSVYKYKGSVASYSNLPSTGLTVGDVYNVEDTGDNYAWTGSAWDKLAGTVDLSGYVPTSRTINSKALTGNITLTQDDIGDGTTYKQFSATEQTKLSGIETGADKTYKGAWDISLQYSVGNIVTNSGKLYICAQNTVANTQITNTDYWINLKDLPINIVYGTGYDVEHNTFGSLDFNDFETNGQYLLIAGSFSHAPSFIGSTISEQKVIWLEVEHALPDPDYPYGPEIIQTIDAGIFFATRWAQGVPSSGSGFWQSWTERNYANIPTTAQITAWNGKQDVMQYSSMPTASADNLGKIVQFTGTTDSTYTNGYFYKCVALGTTPTETYEWQAVETQSLNSAKGISSSVTIAVNDWNNNACTKTISGLGNYDAVFFTPATATDQTNANSAGLFSTASGSTVTFTCTTTPTENITFNYFISRGTN